MSLYLDFAELQAMSRKPMAMAQWVTKLDGFLQLSDRDILTHAGKVSHEAALAKARSEFEKFRVIESSKPSQVEADFSEVIRKLKRIKSAPKPQKPKSDASPDETDA